MITNQSYRNPFRIAGIYQLLLTVCLIFIVFFLLWCVAEVCFSFCPSVLPQQIFTEGVLYCKYCSYSWSAFKGMFNNGQSQSQCWTLSFAVLRIFILVASMC